MANSHHRWAPVRRELSAFGHKDNGCARGGHARRLIQGVLMSRSVSSSRPQAQSIPRFAFQVHEAKPVMNRSAVNSRP